MLLKKQILLSTLLLIQILSSSAQNVLNISGKVQDKKSGDLLIGATVSIKGTKFGTATDYEGLFKLKVTQQLPITLVVSYTGYNEISYELTAYNKPLLIKLSENARELKQVEIRDSRITEKQKQAPQTIETMDAIAIKQTPAANFYEGLAHLKGVDMTSASIGFKIINTRGFNSTSPVRSLQLIDGVDNQSPGLNFSLGNFLGSSELDIQKVDLVVGASGAYYGPNAFNGVINMQTKSPFLFPGFSAQVKVGERNLLETSIRWAQVFKNKKGEDKIAYKVNLFYMRANDWEATNYDATIQSPVDARNPGGYDAVNRYGDEYSTNAFQKTGLSYLGFGYSLRKGYNETDLVDYNSRNIKANAAFHIKIKKDNELIIASSFANGTTVYQGDNRFSLKDILFYQNRVELRKEGKYFIRAYATNEDAGKSYDAYATALLLQNTAKSDINWSKDYAENWNGYIFNKINVIRPPIGSQPAGVNYGDYANQYLYQKYYDSLLLYHNWIGNMSDTLINVLRGGVARFEPGTARFDSALKSITSLTNRQGGSRFFDQSALYHFAGGYQFKIGGIDFNSGANFRLYTPYSKGTIFLDTLDNQRIYNKEFGGYLGAEYKFNFENKSSLKITATNRIDKNQNFDYLFSQALTALFVKKEHVVRFSLSTALRNPTLTDQYINLNVGRATLLGNLNGFDSLVTTGSLVSALNTGQQNNLEYFNVAAVKPERVQTIEFGYRTTIAKKLFLDISYYYSWYYDFLGFKIGAKVDWPSGSPFVQSVNIYRVTANSKDVVTTQGFTIGANYFYKKYLGFAVNYSYNNLDRQGSTDPLIPAFNTPSHKYNIGINGRDIVSILGSFKLINWGYGFNWKWQEGFLFEGSPQFTGYVPSYGMFDAQFNKGYMDNKLTLKIGASNLLDNKVIQVFGGPAIGRMIYVSVLFDIKNFK
jgi:outer membrane receptor protein involved in Fe transport